VLCVLVDVPEIEPTVTTCQLMCAFMKINMLLFILLNLGCRLVIMVLLCLSGEVGTWFSLPRYAYKLRSFQNILANVGDKTYLAGDLCAIVAIICGTFLSCYLCSCYSTMVTCFSVIVDVIGVVTGVSSLVSIDVKGHSTSKCTLCLTDTRFVVSVSVSVVLTCCLLICADYIFHAAGILRQLWGRNAEAIDSGRLIEDSSREPVVALIIGCTHKKQDFMFGCLCFLFL
jgi:replication factor A1